MSPSTRTTHASGRPASSVRARERKHPATPTTATSLLNTIRCRRGLALYKKRARQIWPVASDSYRVPSQSTDGIYQVSLKPGSEHCTCPDYARYARYNRREPGSFFCKHLYAALLYRIKREELAAPPAALSAGRPERAEHTQLERAS